MQRPPSAVPAPALPPQSTLAEFEAAHIRSVLEACGGNKKLAAERLGISRATLYRRMKKYGIVPRLLKQKS
jgi:transcriptional regulator of acetoin/glycerol metabolism